MTGPEEMQQFIRTVMTPVFMATGAASMNWGLQRLQFVVVNRVRVLNEEDSHFAGFAHRETRRAQIREQIELLTRRARYTRNAITGLYAAILALLLCSVSIATVGMLHWSTGWVSTLLFELGMLLICVALIYVLFDVILSYRAVLMDSQHGGSNV